MKTSGFLIPNSSVFLSSLDLNSFPGLCLDKMPCLVQGQRLQLIQQAIESFWSFFHLKQNHTVKSFLPFSHLSMAKEPLSSGLIFNTSQSLMLPKTNKTKDKQKTKTASQVNGPGPSCFLGGPMLGEQGQRS